MKRFPSVAPKERTGAAAPNPAADSPAPIPGVDFMGRGYNIIRFDPLEPGAPDGISQTPIFQLNVSEPTPDRQFLIPQGTVYTPDPRLDFQAESTQLESAFDLGQMFSASIQASGGYGPVSFSASASYAEVNQMTAATAQIVSLSSFQVQVWVLVWQQPALSDAFKEAVRALPVQEDEAAYLRFINTFGTHYPQRVTFGGLGYQSYRYSRENRSRLTTENVSISVAAEVGLALSASVGGETARERMEFESLSAVSESSALLYIGGRDPSSFESFVRTINESPIPVRVTMREITELFTEANFPGMGISTIKNNLQRANEAYAVQNGSGYVRYAASSESTDPVYTIAGAQAPENIMYAVGGSAFPFLSDSKLVISATPIWRLVSTESGAGPIIKTGDTLTVSLSQDIGAFTNLGASQLLNAPTYVAVGAGRTPATRVWRILDPLDPSNTGQPVFIGKTYVLYNVAIRECLGFYYQPLTDGGVYVPVAGPTSDPRNWCKFL